MYTSLPKMLLQKNVKKTVIYIIYCYMYYYLNSQLKEVAEYWLQTLLVCYLEHIIKRPLQLVCFVLQFIPLDMFLREFAFCLFINHACKWIRQHFFEKENFLGYHHMVCGRKTKHTCTVSM